jgi:hypothetical protein
MDLSDVARETYRRCSGLISEPCRYDVDYVIDVIEPGVGEVVFGRLVMDVPYSYSPECEQYVKCRLMGIVGTSVDLPSDAETTFARRKSSTDNNTPQTVEELEAELKQFVDAVEQLEQQGPDGHPDWEYNLAVLHHVIALIEWKLAKRRLGGG